MLAIEDKQQYSTFILCVYRCIYIFVMLFSISSMGESLYCQTLYENFDLN